MLSVRVASVSGLAVALDSFFIFSGISLGMDRSGEGGVPSELSLSLGGCLAVERVGRMVWRCVCFCEGCLFCRL